MTTDETIDLDTLDFQFWDKKGNFVIHEAWGKWMYCKRRGGDAYFIPDDMAGDELNALIKQCEKDGNDKALIARLKDFPVPKEETGA